MGLFSTPKVPNTISDEKYASIQRRARAANPHLDSISDPRAIKARKEASLQLSKAEQN